VRIQSKIYLLLIICTVLPLMAAFALSFKATNESLSVTVTRNLISHAEEQLDTLQAKLASAKHELETLSLLSNMKNVSSGDADGKLQADLDIFSTRIPLFAEILAADEHGKVIASNLQSHIGSDLNGSWEFEAPNLGIHFDGRVVKSYRLKRLVATHSVPLIDNINGGSLTDNDNPIGALIGSIDWQFLQRDLAMKKVFGERQSTQRQMFLESLESDSLLYASPGMTAPWELFRQQESGASTRRVEHLGHNYIMVTIPSKPVGGFRDPRWRLHVLLDADIAYGSVQGLKKYSLLAAALVLLFAMATASSLSKIIVKPVRQLLTGTERIAGGDYDYALEHTDCKDEIGQLTNRFNTMRLAVKNNREELIAKTRIAEQSAKLKGEFLANMSHEVRTPINGVLGMTELLLNTSLDRSQARYAKTIERSGQALLCVINDILDFSKIEAGKLLLAECAFDLRELVEDVVEMVAETAHNKLVEVVLLMDPGYPVAFNGDSTRLRQVLINLMSNAVKFTDEGEVRLIVQVSPGEDGHASLQFDVVDTGIGISTDNKDRIFDSFVQADGSTTRQYGGTGLGLAISSQLVRLMGGVIDVQSLPGEGSTFSFTVRLKQLPKTVEEAWTSANALQGKRILVVDDNKTNCEILQGQVSYWGATALIANGGEQALQLLRRSAVANQVPDIAILDMHMPSINGFDLAGQINNCGLAPSIRCVLLSSAGDLHDPQTLRGAGIESLVHKPARQQDLYNCLIAALDSEAQAPVSQKKIVKAIDSVQLQGHILLAEDNPVNQDMMLEMLRIIGLTCELANDGRDAVSKLERGRFDAVLMDCQMPVLDGFGATDQIRQREHDKSIPRIPIIALTANAMQGDRERCLNAGMDDYLSKPATMNQLRDTLAKWIVTTVAEIPAFDTAASNDEDDLSPDNTLLIDESVFDELWKMSEQAGNQFFNRLLDTYRKSSYEDLTAIANALESGDATKVGAHAHRLKSGTASWGAIHMADLCFQLEKTGKEKQLDGAPHLLKQISSEHEKLLELLHSRAAKAA